MVLFLDNGHLTETEIKYNKIHSFSRMIIERSLGLLKERFKNILDTLPMTRADLIAKYIVVCCILHNICLLHNDMIDIPIIINEIQFLRNNAVNIYKKRRSRNGILLHLFIHELTIIL